MAPSCDYKKANAYGGAHDPQPNWSVYKYSIPIEERSSFLQDQKHKDLLNSKLFQDRMIHMSKKQKSLQVPRLSMLVSWLITLSLLVVVALRKTQRFMLWQ
jgi:hypothetical protein